jgi:hypothetical protein
MLFDKEWFELLDKMIEEKYVSVQKHPETDYYIYNYTQNAQFDRMWNDVTKTCRGLILDGNRNIIARPFSKFFNYSELPLNEIPSGHFTFTDKHSQIETLETLVKILCNLTYSSNFNFTLKSLSNFMTNPSALSI